MDGWVKIHRDLVDHWIWENPKYLKWWLALLLSVNYDDKKFASGGEISTCKSGQSFRSLENWSTVFGCSKPTVYEFFKLLKNDNMISVEIIGKGNQRKMLLTVVNWSIYQEKPTENFTKNLPETLPETYRKLVHNKKEKKERNIKNINMGVFTPPSLDEVISYFNENGYPKNLAERAWRGYDASGWKDSRGKKIMNWKQKMIHVWFKEENRHSIMPMSSGRMIENTPISKAL